MTPFSGSLTWRRGDEGGMCNHDKFYVDAIPLAKIRECLTAKIRSGAGRRTTIPASFARLRPWRTM